MVLVLVNELSGYSQMFLGQRIALSWMIQKETSCIYCSGGILADDQVDFLTFQSFDNTISRLILLLSSCNKFSCRD